MLLDPLEHRLLLRTLVYATSTPDSYPRYDDLIDFIIKTNEDVLKVIREKAEKLVDEIVVSKKRKRKILRAIAEMDESWWRNLSNPPVWARRAAINLIIDEIFNIYALSDDFDIKEVSESFPVYLSKGVQVYVLFKPTASELRKVQNMLSKGEASIESIKIKEILKHIIRNNLKVHPDRQTVEVLGTKLYLDVYEMLRLFKSLDMYEEAQQFLKTVYRERVVPRLARLLNISEDSINVTAWWGADKVSIEIPAQVIERERPELSGIVKSVIFTHDVGAKRIDAVAGDWRVSFETLGRSYTLRIVVHEKSPEIDDAPEFISRHVKTLADTLAQLVSELRNTLSGGTGVFDRVENLDVESYEYYDSVVFNISGTVRGVEARMEAKFTVSSKNGVHKFITTTLYFPLESKRLAVMVEHERLVEDNIINVDVNSTKKPYYMIVRVEHKNMESARRDLERVIEKVSSYLDSLKRELDASTVKIKPEHAVALYLFTMAGDVDITWRRFKVKPEDFLRYVGIVLSKVAPDVHKDIKDSRVELLSIDAGKKVISGLYSAGYLSVGDDGRVYLNGRRIVDILRELNGDISDDFERNLLLGMLDTLDVKLIERVIERYGVLPNSLGQVILKYRPHMLLGKCGDKYVAEYLSDEMKERVVQEINDWIAAEILVKPELRRFFKQYEKELMSKVIDSSPAVLTYYAFRAMPELFAGVPVREVGELHYDNYALEYDKWLCQVGLLRDRDAVFIIYRRDKKTGVAFVASSLREALEKASAQYEQGLRTIELISASAPALREYGLNYDVHYIPGLGLYLPRILAKRGGRRVYYITPTGGLRLIEKLKHENAGVVEYAA